MQLKELRRIVTGIDKDGKSYVAMDGPPPVVAQTPHGGRAEMWIWPAPQFPASHK